MPTLQPHQPFAPSRRGLAAWGFWLLRWTLVLLLLADQIGAPLHHHHHDSGVDGIGATVSAGHLSDGGTHADDDEHGGHFGHATLAIRAAGETVELASVVGDEHAVAHVGTMLAVLSRSAEESASQRPPPRWRSPFLGAHRSLPPAGRAPPSHA